MTRLQVKGPIKPSDKQKLELLVCSCMVDRSLNKTMSVVTIIYFYVYCYYQYHMKCQMATMNSSTAYHDYYHACYLHMKCRMATMNSKYSIQYHYIMHAICTLNSHEFKVIVGYISEGHFSYIIQHSFINFKNFFSSSIQETSLCQDCLREWKASRCTRNVKWQLQPQNAATSTDIMRKEIFYLP